MSTRIAVLVSGSGTNLQALLEAIDVDPDFGGDVVVVGSDQPEAAGLDRARARDIPTVATELGDHPDRATWERDLTDRVRAHDPDLVVLAGFMKILTTIFLDHWPDAVVNVHPSLLPAFRGANAVEDALAAGVEVTGCTVHLVDELVDHGPILAQEAVAVEPDDTRDTLHGRIQQVEHRLLPAVVRAMCHDRVTADGQVATIRDEPSPDES